MKKINSIRAALNECRPLFVSAFVFSLIINVLMLAVPIHSMQVLDRVLSSGSTDTLIMLSLIVAASVLFMGVLQGLRALVFSQIGRWLDETLSSRFVDKNLALAVYKPHVGTQPLRDIATIKGFVSSPALASIFDAPWAVIYFIVIYVINVHLGIAVTLGAVVLLILALLAERLPKRKLDAANDQQVKAMQAFDATLRNAEVVRAMGMGVRARKRWEDSHRKELQFSFVASNINTVVSYSTRTLRLGLQMLLTALGAYLVLAGTTTAGAIIAVSMLSGKALAPFDAAVAIYQSWNSVTKAYKRLSELDEAVPDATRTTRMSNPVGHIAIEKLTYQERTSSRWILRGINISVEGGTSVGIIGPSGAGKTTLGRMIVGVLMPSSGAVRLDGAALDQWDPEQLGNLIGYLPQDVELFSGTVAANIARLDAEAADETIIAAARLAAVHNFILHLPNGYQTDIGANGAALSAGQRQRIALARCFYGQPRLVVLDEPNANLDTDGERALAECLASAKAEGITVFIVSHRPVVLQQVDKILVLHDGEAKLFGPAEEVLAKLTPSAPNVSPLRKPSDDKIELKA